MKTFAECRNEIANKEGHADWLTLVYRENLTSIQLLSEQAAILFAKEFSDEQLKEQNRIALQTCKEFKGQIEERDQQLGLQEIELNHIRTLLASCEKALEDGWMARADQAKIAEKDKEIEKLNKEIEAIESVNRKAAYSDNVDLVEEIASLKEALRKAEWFIDKFDKDNKPLCEEIENLLK